MELVTGAMGSLIPKLKDLLKDEYNLQTGVRDQVRSLEKELESAHAALLEVAKVPPDQLDQVIKIWAREIREASYDMEDILDTFLVRVVEGSSKHNDQDSFLKRLGEKITGLFKKSKERHDIAGAIEKVMKNLQEVTDRRGRYTVDNIVARPAASLRTVDPRLSAMYREASQIIGIDKSSADLKSMLLPKEGDDESSQKKMKIVSVVGVGGLGKTTLAKAVYDELKSKFRHGAFVPVGQDPDVKKVLRDILIDLDKVKYTDLKYTALDERQLIEELRGFLRAKRYFVVIDDIWNPQCWETIKLAFVENNCGNRIIITTRKFEVAKKADEVYKLQSLSPDDSKKLFYMRLFGGEDKCPNNHPNELSDQILKKCCGVPLAIITMASLLLGKSIEEWIEVCNFPGFHRDKDHEDMENTMHILSLSYYDLPSHLKTCLLYLSVFPEDSLIDKDSLIWKWIAEGFIEKKPGRGSFEVGEEYFHDLINRSLIQAVDSEVYGIIEYCRIHDMVLDLIVSMSREQNFVSADGTLSQGHQARRLAIKNRELDLAQDTRVNLQQVRSFIVWWCDIDKWDLHPRLKLIRVLALENCRFTEGCHILEHISNLLHLRYLGIRGHSWFKELPEGLGALKFLQTLHMDGIGYHELPRSIGSLTQLVRLHAPVITPPIGLIGKLTSLEELYITRPYKDDESIGQFVKELGNLRELRVLRIDNTWRYMDESMERDLMQSLSKLQNMQHLTLGDLSIVIANMNVWDAAVSRDLRTLFLSYISFPNLPPWISSAHLPRLTHLEIYVLGMDEQRFKALGELPELRYLKLFSKATATCNIEAADGSFQKLTSWELPYRMVQFVANNEDASAAPFTTRCHVSKVMAIAGRSGKKHDCRVVPVVGVMPKLEELELGVKELTQNNVASCENLGWECLRSLRKVKVNFWCLGLFEEDVEREAVALRQAVEDHPNRPTLQIEYISKEHMKRRSDDASTTYRFGHSIYGFPTTSHDSQRRRGCAFFGP